MLKKAKRLLCLMHRVINLNTDIISYNQVSDLAIVIDKNNNYNIVDSSGNKKLRENYTYIEYFNNNYFIVTKDSKTGVNRWKRQCNNRLRI